MEYIYSISIAESVPISIAGPLLVPCSPHLCAEGSEVASHPKQTIEISHLRIEVRTALSGLEETSGLSRLHLRSPLGAEGDRMTGQGLGQGIPVHAGLCSVLPQGWWGVRERVKADGPIHLN